ncbi:MAG: DUF4178 domain-containing protein [Bacteriovoracaceae bacterium]|jgi:hypothetical protein|nr:DUF4178 domain-containing protein [Bacteriovoracaceae bacterium]
MIKLNCPSCGGEINFRSKTSVFAVCGFCLSNIVRHDVDLSLLGKQSELQEDMSPITIGSLGKFNNVPFFVCGRIIVRWEDGYWNEWYITFKNGTDGWLVEAQGDFAILTAAPSSIQIPASKDVVVGNRINLGSESFVATDIKTMTCVGSEGELPFNGIEGRESVSIDLEKSDGQFATIEYNADDGMSCYLGRYISLNKLKMIGLREFEGWGRP